MNYHKNARLTVQSRAELIRRVQAGDTLRKVSASKPPVNGFVASVSRVPPACATERRGH